MDRSSSGIKIRGNTANDQFLDLGYQSAPKGQPKHPYHPRLNRLACPPSFWRSWTQEQIAEVVGLSGKRVSEIVGNTNFSEIDTLLSQGHDMDYTNILNRSGWVITHIIDCPMSLRAGGHATVSGKHRSPDAKKPNPGDRSTLADYRKKEVIFKLGFWNCRGHLKQLINTGLPLVFPQSSPSR